MVGTTNRSIDALPFSEVAKSQRRAFIPADPTTIKDMLQILVEAERCAVCAYIGRRAVEPAL